MKKLTILFLGFLMAVSFSMSALASEPEPTIKELEERIDALEKRVAALEKLLMETEIETETETKSNQGTKRVENVNTDSLTMGQKNALDSADNYLEIMPFSYDGLIDQLSYDGYTEEDARFAADNCGADWKEQAVKSAANYLEIMSFSKDGLIEQLEYDGYTNDQAVYGAEQNGY